MIQHLSILVLLAAYVLAHPEPAEGQIGQHPTGVNIVLGAGAGLSYLSNIHSDRGAVGPDVKVHAELPLNDWLAAGVQAGFTYRKEETCTSTGPEGTECGREGVFRSGVGLRLRAGHGGSESAVALGLHGRGLQRYIEISSAFTVLRTEPANIGLEGLLRSSLFGMEIGILIRVTPNKLHVPAADRTSHQLAGRQKGL